MTVRGVIEKCDKLFPNQFSQSEKLSFCNELAALIHANYIKKMKRAEIGGSNAAMPAGVTAERVRAVYADGVPLQGDIAEILGRAIEGNLEIEYVDIAECGLDDVLPVSAPYDEMFTYWLLAKICLHNEDAEGYNNYMSLYNALMMEFKKCFVAEKGSSAVRFGNLY